MYLRLCDRRTSESAKQILAINLENGSEYGTKDEPGDAMKHVISVRDIELPDVEIRD